MRGTNEEEGDQEGRKVRGYRIGGVGVEKARGGDVASRLPIVLSCSFLCLHVCASVIPASLLKTRRRCEDWASQFQMFGC